MRGTLPLLLVSVATLPFPVLAADPPSAQAIPVQGKPYAARVVRIDADWQVTLETPSGRRQVPAEELVSWGAREDLGAAMRILLADGSILSGEVIAVTRQQVIANCEPWGEVPIPLKHVRGIVYRPPQQVLEHDRLVMRILNAQGHDDQMLLENEDVISGQLLAPESDVELPLFGQVELALRVGRDEVPVPVSSIVAIIFNPALAIASSGRSPGALLGFRSGSALVVEGVDGNQETVELALAGGLRLKSDSMLWDHLVALRTFSPRVTYLSDVQDIGYKHIPYLQISWPYGRDTNVLGGWLRSGGKIYSKGLGMHSASRSAYTLGSAQRAFQAEIALDDQAGSRGSVVFRVFLHDGEAWKLAFESPTLRGGQPPVPVSVELEGARQLALIVDYADRLDQQDYANWLNARLVK